MIIIQGGRENVKIFQGVKNYFFEISEGGKKIVKIANNFRRGQ